MKRRTRMNAWGNIIGYIGRRRVHDFGTNTRASADWLVSGKLPQFERDAYRMKIGAQLAPQPATPLPWAAERRAIRKAGTNAGAGLIAKADQYQSGAAEGEQNAAYIVHAANRYPEAVQLLKLCRAMLGAFSPPTAAEREAMAAQLRAFLQSERGGQS